MLTFKDLCDEVKRRSVRDQAGTTFDTEIKNVVNTSLFRLAREAAWRVLRRKTYFETKKTYNTGSGSGAYTSGSNYIVCTGANFWTAGIEVGRRIKLGGDSTYYTIRNFPTATSANLDRTYYQTSVAGSGTYSILGQEEYTMPIQAGHRMFLWHNEYGYPYRMQYITDQDFYERGIIDTDQAIPTHYRMWGEDMALVQASSATCINTSSTNAADTSISVTVFGIVSGYPDYEIITTDGSDGTTVVTGSKKFSYVERVTKSASTTGRIIVSDSIANHSISVLPVGDTTAGILYKKIQIYPLPTTVFPINVQYYKDPYRLVNDNDVHELGQEFDEALILLATAKIMFQNQKNEGDKFYLLYQDEVRNLRKTNVDKIDWFPSLRRPDQGFQDAFVHPGLLYRQIGPYFGVSGR